MTVAVYTLDPLQDARWPGFLARHPSASIFHSRGWLDALRRTYGYQPIAYTTSSPTEELANGLVFCRVDSWLTGHRLVSVPFSDHAEPLVGSEGALKPMLEALERDLRRQKWKYVEIRPLRRAVEDVAGFAQASVFHSHR